MAEFVGLLGSGADNGRPCCRGIDLAVRFVAGLAGRRKRNVAENQKLSSTSLDPSISPQCCGLCF
ncbi:unnamed protein product [Arabidopsis halleri]